MIRKTLLLGLAGLMALGVFALGGDSARAGAGSMTAMSLDTDITGNTATSIGTTEECAEANAGESVTIDIVADGIPASNAMIAYVAELTLDDGVLNVTANADTTGLISNAAGSTAFAASDPVPGPGPDNLYYATAADTNIAAAESGDGILARIVIEVNAGAADGIYNINLTAAGHTDTSQVSWAADATHGARIAVGALTCATAFKQGDVDCNNVVNSVDALKVLRSNAGLSVVQTEPCDDIGTGSPMMGNVDCSASGVNSVDALKILRSNASLTVVQTEPCPDIGTPNV